VLQRLIAALLGVLGIAAIGLGVASATVWRADDPLVATAAPGGDNRTLVTDPGVLELAGDPVTVTVRAEGSPVVLAVGRDTDVTAWVGADPYARVTGLSDWHTLATTAGEPPAGATPEAEAEAAAEPAPSPSASGAAEEAAVQAADPTGSDMWVLEAGGDGSATLDWPAQDGRWSLIAVSLGDTAPTLDLSWPQTVTTPWLWPAVALGILLLAVAAVLLVRILRSRDDPDAGWHPVSTGAFATIPAPAGSRAAAGSPGTAAQPAPGQPGDEIPVGTVGAPTRRQLREAEAAAAAAAAERRRGRRTPTGSIPAVTGATPVVTGSTPAVTGSVPAVRSATPSDQRAAAEPAAPTAPSGIPTAPGAAESPAEPRRGLTGRLPWRKGRAEQDDTGAAAAGTAEAPAAAAPAAGAPAPAVPATPGPPAAAPSGSWSPAAGAPAAPPAAAPSVPGPAAGRPAPTPVSPVAGPGAPVGPARPAAPPTTPAGTPSAGAGAPGAPAPRTAPRTAGDDDAASRAQRADAWRRMWGFPADAGDPAGADAAREDDARGTEEDR
jgi:hypothetical protein